MQTWTLFTAIAFIINSTFCWVFLALELILEETSFNKIHVACKILHQNTWLNRKSMLHVIFPFIWQEREWSWQKYSVPSSISDLYIFSNFVLSIIVFTSSLASLFSTQHWSSLFYIRDTINLCVGNIWWCNMRSISPLDCSCSLWKVISMKCKDHPANCYDPICLTFR